MEYTSRSLHCTTKKNTKEVINQRVSKKDNRAKEKKQGQFFQNVLKQRWQAWL